MLKGIERDWRQFTQTCALLALLVWVCHFFHASQFGVYEDDWARIPYVAGVSFGQFLHVLRGEAFTTGLNQGRPLHPFLIETFSFLGLKTGSLFTLYVIGFLIQGANVVLFFALLLRSGTDREFATLAAIAYCLFPADTTQPFLTHALGVQTALTLLLVAAHCYLSGWRVASYLAVFLLLFTYETPYLLFATVPLLTRASRRERYRHWAVMAALLGFAVIYRRVFGDDRVAHLQIRQLLIGATNLVTGPLTCIVMFVYRPLETLAKLRGWDWVFVVLAIAGFVLLLRQSRQSSDTHGGTCTSPDVLRLGLLLLVLAYPLTLTTVGISISGRGTRVHTAAVFGASVLFAWIAQRLLKLSRRPALTTGLLGATLGLLLGFGLVVQHDYVLSWQEQRGFWTDMIALLPPLRDGDVILVEPSGLRDSRQLLFLRKDLTGVPGTRQIRSLDDLLQMLPALYQMPPEWSHVPQVLRMPPRWKQQLFTPDGQVRLLTIEQLDFDKAPRTSVPPDKAVLVLTSGADLSRVTTVQDPANGKVLQLNQKPGPISNLRPSGFFSYVIDRSGHSTAPYLVGAPAH